METQTIDDVMQEVRSVLRDVYASNDDIRDIAMKLLKQRKSCNVFDPCLAPGRPSVWTFAMSRLREKGRLCGGAKYEPNFRLTVDLHFWSWDEEKYGKWSDTSGELQRMMRRQRESQSLIGRIVTSNAEPIDIVSYRMDLQNKSKE